MQRALSCLVVFAAILCIAIGGILGCSPQKRYEVLTFFFDGVPVPGGAQGVGANAQLVNYLHKPYAEGKCGSCHASDDVEMSITEPTRIGEMTSSICLKCHDKIPGEYPVMHGPVATAECMMCHSPHESGVPHLLKATAPRICIQCHTPELMTPRRSEHQDEKADCLKCHSGHGGPRHGLLRPLQATTRPSVATTRPTATGGQGT